MKTQNEFPYLEKFKQLFPVDKNTVFAYDGEIYANKPLPADIEVHEQYHLKRQKIRGADDWIEMYLTDPKFRLDEEILAYRAQLESIPDRGKRNYIRIECAQNLSGDLYNKMLTFSEAMKMLQ